LANLRLAQYALSPAPSKWWLRIAALLALFWLKPVAARTVAESNSGLHTVDMTTPMKARGVA